MRLDVILRIISKLLLPFMLMFALYVQFHADYGPGGGFQAGVTIAATIILYAIMFGLDAAMKAVPVRFVEIMVPLGVLIFGGVGVASLFLGGNYLDYDVLAHEPTHGQHLGVILVEIGVLISVTGTMLAIFYAFAGRGR